MICLVDLSAIFAQAWSASGPEVQGAGYDGALGAINRIANANPTNVAICCDSRTNWRKAVAPEYKAHREKRPATYYAQLDRVKQRLVDDGYLLWSAEGFEADDVIATATDAAYTADHEVLIATSDKDLLQLVCPKVHVLRTHSWDTWGEAQVVEKFGVRPGLLGMWLALVGDTADNVPGCPLVGPKVATKLVATYESWPALWAAVGTPPGVEPTSKGKESAINLNLRTYRTQVELAAKLVALSYDAPIKFTEIFETRARKAQEEDEMPHDLGAIQEEMEERGLATHVVDVALGPPPADAQKLAPPPPVVTTQAPLVLEHPKVLPGIATALVTAKSSAPDLGAMFGADMRPTKMDGCWWLARRLFESKLYQRFPNPEAILAVMLTGLEFGLSPMQSVAPGTFSIIQGSPCPGAHLLIAQAMKHPDCEYLRLVESTPERCTYETKPKRDPEPTRLTFTIEEARAAGLTNAQWKARPAVMIRKTCGVQLARIAYPGALLGMYAAEEME